MWAKQYGKTIHLGIVYTIYKKMVIFGRWFIIALPTLHETTGPKVNLQ